MKEEVLKRIDALAAKMGVAAEHLWSALVRQAAIEGWFYAILLPALFSVSLWAFYREMKKEMDTFDMGTMRVIYGCVVLGSLIAIVAAGPGILAGIANPEYWVFCKVLGR